MAKQEKGTILKDIILGGQDGIVNILGLVLGVATATATSRIVLISGLAGTVAESLSMAAVAYTSSKAARDYYRSKIKKNHNTSAITKKMAGLVHEYEYPLRDGMIVGMASVIGSLIPLVPFFLLPVKTAMVASIILAVTVLFLTGSYKAKLTGMGTWQRSGTEMAIIGTLAAIAGYAFGVLLQYV